MAHGSNPGGGGISSFMPIGLLQGIRAINTSCCQIIIIHSKLLQKFVIHLADPLNQYYSVAL